MQPKTLFQKLIFSFLIFICLQIILSFLIAHYFPESFSKTKISSQEQNSTNISEQNIIQKNNGSQQVNLLHSNTQNLNKQSHSLDPIDRLSRERPASREAYLTYSER